MTEFLDKYVAANLALMGALPDAKDALAVFVTNHVQLDANDQVQIIDAHGNLRLGPGTSADNLTLDEFLAEVKATRPTLFKQDEAPAPKPLSRSEQFAADMEAALKARANQPPPPPIDDNPWHPKTRNLTLQMAILKRDPAMAERLKAEARYA